MLMKGKLLPGDLIFQEGSDFGAKLVRFWTHSNYSHVAMYAGSGIMIHSTLRHGVVMMYYETWKEYYAKTDTVDIYRPVKEISSLTGDVLQWTMRRAGRPYDIRGILKFVLDRLHMPFLKEQADAYFCSELVASAWESVGVRLVDKEPYKISPADLSRSSLLKKVGKSVGVEVLSLHMATSRSKL